MDRIRISNERDEEKILDVGFARGHTVENTYAQIRYRKIIRCVYVECMAYIYTEYPPHISYLVLAHTRHLIAHG